MAEVLVHLAQHSDRDMREVEVVPVEFALEAFAGGLEPVQNGMQVVKEPATRLLSDITIELPVFALPRLPFVGRGLFVDQP